MTHRDKVHHLIAELAAHGIRPIGIVPPIYRFFWLLGIKVPPPHFQSFVTLALMTSSFFGLAFLNLTLLWRWRSPDLPGWLLWALPVTAGPFFGLLLTAAYRYSASLLRLPAWKDYPLAGTLSASTGASPWMHCDSWVRLLFGVAVAGILIAIAIGKP